ncbi:AAA family ATPase [Salana multivorans]
MTQTRPWALVVTGPPGAGKSTTAAAVARRLGAGILDLDSMTNPLVETVAVALGVTDFGDPRFAELTRDARYECLLRTAQDCLGAGVPVLLVAPFTRETRDEHRWRELASRLHGAGGEPVLVWVGITPDVLIERIRGRGVARDTEKLTDVSRYVAGLDLTPPPVPHVELDGRRTPQEQTEALLAALGIAH